MISQKKLDEDLKLSLDRPKGTLCKVFVIAGLPGYGKTSTIKAWAKKQKVPSTYIDVSTLSISKVKVSCCKADLDPDIKKGKFVIFTGQKANDLMTFVDTEINVIFDNNLIDEINDPKRIVILDHYDLGSRETRDELIKYIRLSIVNDPRLDFYPFERKIDNAFIIVIYSSLETGTPFNEIEEQMLGKQIKLKK